MSSIVKENSGKELTLLINRQGKEITKTITPETSAETGKGAIGVSPYQDEIVKKYGFLQAIVNGVKEAANMIIEVVALLFGFLLSWSRARLRSAPRERVSQARF
jgi:hypothetical protein